jgi:hypothetical protein
VNDIAFTADGSAYVTDSFIPVVFRVGGDPPAMDQWADLSAAGVPWPTIAVADLARLSTPARASHLWPDGRVPRKAARLS